MVDKISLTELRQRLEANPAVVLVEALPEQHYRHSHIAGAINHDEVDALAPELLPDKDAEIVVYCASATCQNSGIAANRLATLGYTNVRLPRGQGRVDRRRAPRGGRGARGGLTPRDGTQAGERRALRARRSALWETRPGQMTGHARIATSLVGSYAQPDWLIDRERLRERFPPRVRATELWRVAPGYLEEAQDDATRLAIADQERAGLDIVTDGEMRRESYSNRFATALEGVDVDNPGTALDRSGHPNPVPRVVGPVARRHPVQVRDMQFLRTHTSRQAKMTVPGPFTMSQQAQDDYYGAPDALGMAYADAVRGEILDLFEAGADVVQVDEPYMQARPEAARNYGLDVVRHATDGIAGTTAIHICFGYAAIIHDRPSGYSFLPELAATECEQISIETAQSGLALDVLDALTSKTIILGALDLSTDEVEAPETVADRIRRAFPHADPGRLIAAPDCGMKYLPRDAAYGKLEALVAGARIAEGAPVTSS